MCIELAPVAALKRCVAPVETTETPPDVVASAVPVIVLVAETDVQLPGRC